MKEYSALNLEQLNYVFYRIFIYESADRRLEGQTFFPLQPLVIWSGEPRKNWRSLSQFFSEEKKMKG